MRFATAALVALAVSPAAAETATSVGSACEVRFVRAPDDVRHVIEQWLAAEPRCSSTIDLRVIPTESGYYLIAQRPDGRLHERLVPDAQSAGVLVASWVADDWVAPPPPAPAPTPIPGGYVPQYTTPSETSAVKVAPPPRPAQRPPRWLTVGAMFDTDRSQDGGLRAELDMISRGALTLGVSLAYTETSMRVSSSMGYASELRSDDFAATVYGAYALRYGRWELRGALGAGAVYSEVDGIPGAGTGMESFYGSGSGAVLTASLLATLRLGDRWGINAGLTSHVITEQLPTTAGSDVRRTDTRVFFFTGLRRRI